MSAPVRPSLLLLGAMACGGQPAPEPPPPTPVADTPAPAASPLAPDARITLDFEGTPLAMAVESLGRMRPEGSPPWSVEGEREITLTVAQPVAISQVDTLLAATAGAFGCAVDRRTEAVVARCTGPATAVVGCALAPAGATAPGASATPLPEVGALLCASTPADWRAVLASVKPAETP